MGDLINFYKCYDCNINLCNICENNHDDNHNIMNFNEINYKCRKHNNDYFAKYFNKCKMNICFSCEAEHSGHNLTYFGNIMSVKKQLINKLNFIKSSVDKCNVDFTNIITKLNETINFITTFDLYNEITKTFEGIIEIVNVVKYNVNSYYNLKKILYLIFIMIKNIIIY